MTHSGSWPWHPDSRSCGAGAGSGRFGRARLLDLPAYAGCTAHPRSGIAPSVGLPADPREPYGVAALKWMHGCPGLPRLLLLRRPVPAWLPGARSASGSRRGAVSPSAARRLSCRPVRSGVAARRLRGFRPSGPPPGAGRLRAPYDVPLGPRAAPARSRRAVPRSARRPPSPLAACCSEGLRAVCLEGYPFQGRSWSPVFSKSRWNRSMRPAACLAAP